MPLSSRSFLFCFVSLCAAFVPVICILGWFILIEPVSALVLEICRMGICRPAWFIGINASIYIGVFTGVGALVYFLISYVPWRNVRVIALGLVLLLPVLSSFARVITYSGWGGSGGTYTFWEAVHRYFEKRR
jgi:hypothetical protein